ncbi:MAG TPA: phosphoglucosamine mutase [Gaiellaceae bacterium]|jgi:phosphoglucosamine mutase|nr:phosphoglucosamine mutase [Gaiellaceae bacterium]
MARQYFGTDGVRGVVGEALTEDLVERLGRAFARWSSGDAVLVGRDTRASGPALEAALASGLAAGGSDVTLGGVLPTPAVALLAAESGAVVSASHNPAEYNGIKLFRNGLKLEDAEEEAIEGLLDAGAGPGPVGEVTEASGFGERYVELVAERFGGPLDRLRVVVDCANGAMVEVAPVVFERLGAIVTVIGDAPDGTNINEGCGATDLGLLSRTVAAGEFDLGVAFDGDGDRLLAVDAGGAVVDGDQILAVLAAHLGVDLVAVTQMTNLGFHRLMRERGIEVLTTDVGDRYVLEALRAAGGVLGGEQSGHVIYLNGHVTGDGLAAALLLCRAVVERERPLAELAAFERFPQVMENVPVRSKELPASILEEAERINEALGDHGRVLVRPSGTEPVVRVLAEAETAQKAQQLCGTIVPLVQRELG